MAVVESFHELLQGEYLTVIRRAPSEQRHKVDDRLRHESLLDQVLIGRMPAPLAQLFVIFICDQRTVYIDRDLPAERLVEAVIFRGGGQIFVASHHVGDPHEMIIHDICEIIGREPVRLNQDHIIQLTVRNCDVSVDLIVEGSLAFVRYVQADDPRFPRRKICLYFFPAQAETVLVINHNVRPVVRNRCLKRLQTFLITEAVIGVSLLHKLLCVFEIQPGRISLALHIGTVSAVFVRTFIMNQACLLQSPVDDVERALDKSLLIRILHSKDKVASFMLRDQICVQRCTEVSYMHPSRRARCKSCSYFLAHRFFILV